jgi:hypothetical protein
VKIFRLRGFCPHSGQHRRRRVAAKVYPELAAIRPDGRTPDMRGMFLRGYGSQSFSQNNGSTVGVTSTLHESGALGQVQGDAIRNIRGQFGRVDQGGYANTTTLPFIRNSREQRYGSGGSLLGTHWDWILDISTTVPTASENRPANRSVRYIIKAKR